MYIAQFCCECFEYAYQTHVNTIQSVTGCNYKNHNHNLNIVSCHNVSYSTVFQCPVQSAEQYKLMLRIDLHCGKYYGNGYSSSIKQQLPKRDTYLNDCL